MLRVNIPGQEAPGEVLGFFEFASVIVGQVGVKNLGNLEGRNVSAELISSNTVKGVSTSTPDFPASFDDSRWDTVQERTFGGVRCETQRRTKSIVSEVT